VNNRIKLPSPFTLFLESDEVVMPDKSTEAQSKKKQPNSKHCFVCGVENPVGLQLHFYDNDEDQVFADYIVPDHFQGYPGVVHGGILATMLDELMGRAVMAGDPNRFMYSAKLEVRYRKPVPTGQPLHLVGKFIRRRGRVAISHAEVWLEDGTLGAEAEGTLVDLPESHVDEKELEAFGWRVYSEGSEMDAIGGEDDRA
jgi:acyl-coenzyme A thioesterase PaaI-like protein